MSVADFYVCNGIIFDLAKYQSPQIKQLIAVSKSRKIGEDWNFDGLVCKSLLVLAATDKADHANQ